MFVTSDIILKYFCKGNIYNVLRGDEVGFLKNVFQSETTSEIDIEDFLNNLDVEEEAEYEPADAYVKPMALSGDEDAESVIQEVREGNIVLLNISALSKRNAMKLKELVTAIKGAVNTIDGDIARISHDRVLVTPSKVKIVKKR